MGQISITTPNMVEIAGRAPTVDQKMLWHHLK